MPDEHDETRLESDMEELTLSQVAAEFRIKRSTLNVWVWSGKLPSRPEYTELGVKYYLVRRGEVSKLLQSRSKQGRPLNRT